MNAIHFAEEPRHVLCIFDGDAERVGNLVARVRFNRSYWEQAEQLARQFAASDEMLAALKMQEAADKLHGIYDETGASCDYLAWEAADAKAATMRRDVLAKLEGNNVKG